MAASKALFTTILLLSAVVAAYTATEEAARDGGKLQAYVGDAGPMASVTSGKYAVCRRGCPDAFLDCRDWCEKLGYKKGGVCIPPYRQNCCCVGPRSS